MTSYLELKEQAESLLAQAEKARKAEMAEAIQKIKSLMQAYDLTLDDLRVAGIRGSTPAKNKTPSPPKYRGPNGQTWSGGRGRKPDWVQQALKEGRSLEEFAIA